jgi:antitoxin component YwqK of YwqJK toxin-antitoxin module
MEKQGNLKGFSDEQKEEFIKVCNANFFFYDPYKDLLINPITSKKYRPKLLQRAFNYSNNSFEEKLSSKFPTKAQVDGSFDKLYSRKERAYILHRRIFCNLKYLGLILGGVLLYFIDFNFGLAVGLYLIYFDYNIFDNVNGVIDHIQSEFMTAMIWQKKRNLYFFGSLLLILGSLVSLYLFTNSIYIVIGVFFAQKFFLVNPTVEFIASAYYRGTEVAIKLEEEFEKQSKKNDFLDAFPKGIKINEVKFYDDNLCEYEEVEELKIFYETPEDQYFSKHLFVYSKEPIEKENLDRVIMSDGIATQLLRLDNDDRVKFYFEHIPNKPETTYFVIAKEDFMSIHEFEGTNSRCIVKSFHNNGKIDSYQEYEDGIMHGKMIEFHDNGQKHLECDFENGLLLPFYYEWKFADGKIMMSGSLRNLDNQNPEQKDLYDPNSEFRIGKWEIFDEDGSLIKSVDYKADGERQTIKEDKEKAKNLIWL